MFFGYASRLCCILVAVEFLEPSGLDIDLSKVAFVGYCGLKVTGLV